MKKLSIPGMESCSLDLEVDIIERIQRLMSLDLYRIRTFMVVRQGFNAEQVEAMEVEYKRFLCLSIVFPTKAFPISNAVDEMWHAHILFTNEYHEASEIVGRDYIHHLPTLSEGERAELEPQYFEDTLGCYQQLFGDPSEVWWPKDSAQICWSCSASPQGRACPREERAEHHLRDSGVDLQQVSQQDSHQDLAVGLDPVKQFAHW